MFCFFTNKQQRIANWRNLASSQTYKRISEVHRATQSDSRAAVRRWSCSAEVTPRRAGLASNDLIGPDITSEKEKES